ncbi:glycosyltransferase [Pseudomonas luteola]|uniref:glycosyltransferase family 4 protein n=1 Tax=Pseudomonas luteola TaxID=47886 RepID=UPI003A8999A9
MSDTPAIHQFSIDCSSGDGITNGMLLIRKLLQGAGVRSEIYCPKVPEALKGQITLQSEFVPDSNQVLLIHHGISNNQEDWLKELPSQKFMVFHNITPAEHFAADHPIQPLLTHGWEQVSSWKNWLSGAIADSEQNKQELLERGYNPSTTVDIPLLVDLDRIQVNAPVRSDEPRPFTLLFVGRVMPHKAQGQLIETLYHLMQMVDVPVELLLVGGTADREYQEKLHGLIAQYGLEHAVNLTGKVSDETLNQLYQRSDLFVSLSGHEGFGMPLIEAMAHQVPVLAYAAPRSNVAYTLGNAGLVLESQDAKTCAATIAVLMKNPALRHSMIARGNEHLKTFTHQALYDRLRHYLDGFNVHLPDHQFDEPVLLPQSQYRVEGPFDSSYSLALVNRELARALKARGARVSLRATEGPGPIEVSADFLKENPDCAEMYARAQEPAEAVLRLLYPPRVTDMGGELNVLNCYGWEESRLPEQACRDFNHQLGLATTMSHYVTRVLQDNGVDVPLATVGIGVDHIERTPAAPERLPTLPVVGSSTLRMLHISSCFPRKGVDVLLAAYGQAFSATDDVVLVLKTFPNPHHQIEAQLKDWRLQHTNPPRVELINQDLPDSAVRALYEWAHVLVAPSRGEGFGLPMAEAMLHRCAVITTGYGGQRDFCTPETSWLIDYRFARAQTHMQLTGSVWVEPQENHLATLMEDFYRARQENRWEAFTAERLAAAEHLIRSEFTWAKVAERSGHAIKEARQQPLLKPCAKVACVTTWNSACGIATYSQKLLSPALGDCLVFANDDATLTAQDGPNVERCWTAGTTHSLDRLIEAIDRHNIEQLFVQFNFSFFNMEAFRGLLQHAHRRGIQTLVTFHSTADVDHGGELKSLRHLKAELASCARLLVHAVSDLNRLLDFGLAENAMLFPHGVMPIAEVEPGPAQLASELQHKRVIASYGFLLPHKGIYQLIDAFALLAKQQPDLHLLLVNAIYPVQLSADEAERCRAHAVELGLESRITFVTDYLEDADSLAWLSLADVIVFPYQHTQESSSAAVRWGLCAGKPVLCTPLTIFEDVEEAVITLPGTAPADMAKGLGEYFAHSEAPRQQAWLKANAWPSISRRLQGLLTALHWEQLAKH